MKLNMSIYMDWLEKYEPIADVRSDKFEIETVRLFSNDIVMNNDTLYVGTFKDLFKGDNNKVILVHRNDIILLNTDDIMDVFNEMISAKDYYAKWEIDMLKLLKGNSVLQDLLDASEDMIKHPVLMLDVGQRTQAISKIYVPDNSNLTWKQMVDYGTADTELLTQINAYFPKRVRKKGVYRLNMPMFEELEYHRNFFLDNDYIGCAVVLDLVPYMTKGQQSLFELFCNYVDEWYQLHIQDQESTQLKHLLTDALRTDEYDYSELHRLLILKNWQMSDKLKLVQLITPHESFHFNPHMCRILESRFLNVIGTVTDKSVCLLCNVSQKSWSTLEQELKPWAKGSQYFGCISPEFSMKDNFRDFYLYTELTLQYCDRVAGEFYDGQTHQLEHILHQFKKTALVEIHHQALVDLKEYDETHHTELYHTLYVYLKHERSNLLTATELALHRNSLAYRIRQIEQIIKVDLDDYHKRLLLLLVYELEKEE